MTLFDLLEIEKKEKDVLNGLKIVFQESLDDFLSSYRNSLEYLDNIVLPLAIASKNDKSFNPFAEIIEKHICFIANQKMQDNGYNILPLSYSGDLTFEKDDFIVHIDIKTANLGTNKPDYNKTIAMRTNQISHSAHMSLNRKPLPDPYCVYPSIPPIYETNSINKLSLSYGLLFIYPSYSNLMNDFREKYMEIFEIFERKIAEHLYPKIEEKHEIYGDVRNYLRSKEEKKKFEDDNVDNCKKIDLIVENMIRGLLIHKIRSEEIIDELEITEEEQEIIYRFVTELISFKNNLKEIVNSVNIILIAVPNGLLESKYLGDAGRGLRLQSGKSNLQSARFYYDRAYFELIEEERDEEEPISYRVQFIHLENDCIEALKKYFPETLHEKMERFVR